MRVGAGIAAVAVAAALNVAAPSAHAQVPVPGLPPLGGLPPPQQQPPPSSPPPSSQPQPQSPSPASPAAPAGTVAGGGNPARSGWVADYTLAPPLARRWSVRSNALFLLAAGGRLFEIKAKAVQARNARSGRVLWSTGTGASGGRPQGAAYDGGIVFVQFFDDIVAFDAASGRQLWSYHLTDVAFAEQPVAAGGVVYAYYSQGGGTLVALRGSDGQRLWAQRAVDGSGGAALAGDRLYLGGACANAQALSLSGGSIWGRSTGCSGGGSDLAQVYGGRVWVPDEELWGGSWLDPPVLDAATGQLVARTSSGRYVFTDGIRLGNAGHGLAAHDALSGKLLWRARGGALNAALGAGHEVLGFWKQRLVLVDAWSGLVTWSSGARLPDPTLSDSAVPLLAVADDMAFVWSSGRLAAYSTRLRPTANAIAASAGPSEVVAGEWSLIGGVLGSALRGGSPEVEITAAPWHRGRFEHFARAASTAGGFQTYAQLFRNTRFRAAAAGQHSRTFVAYAFPDVRLGRTHRRNGLLHVSAVVLSPHTRLTGKTLFLYVGRPAGARRIAGGRLHGRRGKARTMLSFAPLRHVRRADRIYFCVRGALGQGLGRPDGLTRRCGGARVRPR